MYRSLIMTTTWKDFFFDYSAVDQCFFPSVKSTPLLILVLEKNIQRTIKQRFTVEPKYIL